MRKTFQIAFSLGATLAGTFTNTMGMASSQVNKLGAALNDAETGKGKIQRFLAVRKGLEKTKQDLASAREQAAGLKAEFNRTRKPTLQMKKAMEAAGKKVHRLEQRTRDQRRTLGGLKREMEAAGISTRKLSSEHDRLGRAFDRAKASRDRLNRSILKGKEIQKKRDEYRGRLMDAAALGAAAGAPVIGAANIEETETRLSTVINADDKKKAMAEAKSTARSLAGAGLTSFADAYNIQYALNSAGLGAQASRLGSVVVAKVAKITSGIPENVGEVIATTYNNLGSQLEGTTEQKMNRIGEVLTKVQLKYQIRDFNQLGESMKEGAAGLANYNVNLVQGASLLGQLNSAGLQGSKAGTGLNAVLRNLSKASQEWGTDLVRNEKGEMDVIATMRQMKQAMEDMYGDDIDARADAVQKIFGEEGAKGFVPLINKLDELGSGLKDVAENSKGLMDSEIAKFADDTKMIAKKAAGSVSVLSDALGRMLLPTVNSVLEPIAALSMKGVELAEGYPGITKGVMGVTVGTMSLGTATIAGAYAFTFLHGAVTKVKTAYAMLKASSLGAAVAQRAGAIATGIMTAAQWALNAAMSMNPIGLVIKGAVLLGGLGVLLYKKWEPFRNFIDGIWERLKSVFSWVGKLSRFLPGFGKTKVPELSQDRLKSAVAAKSGGSYDISISPDIHVSAGVDKSMVRQAVDAGMAKSLDGFKATMDQVMHQERRLAYE